MRAYAGIDNGLDGGVFAVTFCEGGAANGTVVLVERAPVIEHSAVGKHKRKMDVRAMVRIVEQLRDIGAIVMLEEAQAMPGQGVSSTFSIGLGRGLWEGMLAMAGVPYQTAYSRTWMAELFKGMPASDGGKARSIEFAQRTFPLAKFVPDRCRVPHDGLCDAACLAWYAKVRNGG